MTLTEKILSHVHHTLQPLQGEMWRRTHTKQSQVEINMFFQESCSETERQRICIEHREIRDFLELQADYAAQGVQAPLSKLSKAEYHTMLLLEEQKDQLLSEARFEMNMQELRFESADRAVRESSLQIRSQIVMCETFWDQKTPK